MFEVIQAAIFEYAVSGGDQARGSTRIGIPVLVNRIGRYINNIARLPLKSFNFILRRPVKIVRDFYVTVLVQVVAFALQYIQAFLGEVTMLS